MSWPLFEPRAKATKAPPKGFVEFAEVDCGVKLTPAQRVLSLVAFDGLLLFF